MKTALIGAAALAIAAEVSSITRNEDPATLKF